MITIEIRNADELIARHRGRWMAKLIGFTGKSDELVERMVVKELETALQQQGVEAEIAIVKPLTGDHPGFRS